eukprot:scaffold2325_cov193-Alexandrium_tamarense.AAC.4
MARYRDTDTRQKQTDDVFSGREISCDFNEHCNNSTATGEHCTELCTTTGANKTRGSKEVEGGPTIRSHEVAIEVLLVCSRSIAMVHLNREY